MAGPVFACVTPHPPIIVPEVGRGKERTTAATVDAFATLRQRLDEARPQSLLLICPHGPINGEAFSVLRGRLLGNLGRFGAADVRFERACDGEIVEALLAEAAERGVTLRAIDRWDADDHSAWVPLYYLQDAAPEAPVTMLSISFGSPHDHYALGRALGAVLAESERRVAIIASADGAHALKPDGPYGFHPAAPRFEEEFEEAFLAWDVERMLAFDDEYRRLAAEDSIPSVAILMGALDGLEVRPRLLASEGPWGVGYMTALVEIGAAKDRGEPRAEAAVVPGPVSPTPAAAGEEIVALARAAVEAFLREGRWITEPPLSQERWRATRAGAFISIFDGEAMLRGCIGTLEPTQPNVLAEVISNAIAAATRDPRFTPVRVGELPQLRYKVDVLGEPEPIANVSQLQPQRYGVVVECGQRRGILLPDLNDVESAEEQVAIARQKGGIGPDEPVTLHRFEVERYAE